MHYETIRHCVYGLENLNRWLDKAEAYAETKDFPIENLLQSRLTADMHSFIYQVTSACDYVKGGAARLAGVKPPRHPDTEQTLEEVRERIRKTIEYALSIPESDYANASELMIRVPWRSEPAKGDEYLREVIVPNVYFPPCHGLQYPAHERC